MPWDGKPVTLKQNESVNLPQTTDGSMILIYLNRSPGNDEGTLSIQSGGKPPTVVTVPPGTMQPGVMTQNWEGNNLQVANLSTVPVDIWVAAYGIGLNPSLCTPLTPGSTQPLQTMTCVEATALPQWMTLRFEQQTSATTVFALIGGPSIEGINAYVFGLNMPPSTGPQPAPPSTGYFQTSADNSIDYPFNWGSASLWVANLSGGTAAPASVTLLVG